MKARTKLQHQVTELSNLLPRITPNQEQWAYKNCLPHKGYANKTSAFCLDCGNTFSLDLIKRNRATCPHCDTKLTIEQTRKTTNGYTNYFAITHVVENFQVVENFEITACYKKGKPVRYLLHAILEYWILPNLKTTMVGFLHTTTGYCDSWGGNWEIREENRRGWHGLKYNVYPRFYHPDSEFKPEYKKIGIDHNLNGINIPEAIRLLPNRPKAETLLKAKQYSLLGNYQSNSSNISYFWHSVKICLRNKYKVKDSSMWIDYLELLQYFKKDLHNAKYVCPRDLKKEHDRLMNKKREIQRLQEQERNRKEAIKRQENLEKAITQYTARFKEFFELEIKKDNISIQILKSVDEFKQEGDELKHCVFTNEYYLKKDSLIFSAKVDGKRTETIEIKLPTFKIEQSRGIHNNLTEHHDSIINLVQRNISKIRKIAKKSNLVSRKKEVA